MTVVVNPYIEFASRVAREKFLSLVRDVAHETQSNEPQCLAYCWTTPVRGDPSTDSSALLQGLEVYASEDALAITHRSGSAYKRMREVVAATSLLPYPKGGVPTYVPAGSGFLGKDNGKIKASEMVSAEDYFVAVQYTTPAQDTVTREALLRQEQLLAKEMESIEDVLAVWCFMPGVSEDDAIPVTIFIRLVGGNSYKGFVGERIRRFEDNVLKLGEVHRTRLWEGQGFGFFRQVK